MKPKASLTLVALFIASHGLLGPLPAWCASTGVIDEPVDLLGVMPGAAPAAGAASAPKVETMRQAPLAAPAWAGANVPNMPDEPPAPEDPEPEAGDVERIAFRRSPVRVVLQPNRERLITFPGPVAFHAPEGFDALVRAQIIDRTAYLSALKSFRSLRVVAEDLATGRHIPIDLVSDNKSGANLRPDLRPVEVVMAYGASTPRVSAGNDASMSASRAQQHREPLDMVGLTRYAAQSLYAPRRLAPVAPGVRQLPVAALPVEGLYRGWRMQTTPIGAWRSGALYVTAVRFVNQGPQPQDIDLQELRGRWLAATAQHTRLLAAGSDWNTTTVYLVCDRPFDACR